MRQTWYYTVTGYSFAGRSFAEIADTCVAAGFRGIECAPWIARAAAGMGYRGSMCIETVPFARSVRDVYPVEAWRELVAGTVRLAEAALAG